MDSLTKYCSGECRDVSSQESEWHPSHSKSTGRYDSCPSQSTDLSSRYNYTDPTSTVPFECRLSPCLRSWLASHGSTRLDYDAKLSSVVQAPVRDISSGRPDTWAVYFLSHPLTPASFWRRNIFGWRCPLREQQYQTLLGQASLEIRIALKLEQRWFRSLETSQCSFSGLYSSAVGGHYTRLGALPLLWRNHRQTRFKCRTRDIWGNVINPIISYYNVDKNIGGAWQEPL